MSDSSQEPYNPLAKVHLGESVAEALLGTPVRPLSDTPGLIGAGVYAIYYSGPFATYRMIRHSGASGPSARPIYVGKAVPKGSRKGGTGYDASEGAPLRSRLRQHADTISQATNLKLDDFHYRALMVDDIWIPLGENVLIERFKPLWNSVVDGFGNKTPGAGRKGSMRSQWDSLHPGRKFVADLGLAPNALGGPQLEKRISDFLAGRISEPVIPWADEEE